MSRVQTTQSTGKTWKLIQAVGVIGMAGGLAALWQTGRPECGIVLAVAVPTWMLGRAGAWWFHA